MTAKQELIAPCGLDCESCEIRLAPFDPQAAEVVVAWYQKMGWLKVGEGMTEVLERGMICQGCRGDRSVHWSADCWILKCCVDEKGLAFCYECDEFPCQRLTGWSTQNDSYAQALSCLKLKSDR